MTIPWILSLDIGTSSVKAVGYAPDGRSIPGLSTSESHCPSTTPDGGSEFLATDLFDRCLLVLRRLLDQVDDQGAPMAVAISSLWHSLIGIDADYAATTPVYLWADTRSADYVATLCSRIPSADLHTLTGCFPHTSYLPVKLIWLMSMNPDAFNAACYWVSFADYLCAKLFGVLATSYSLASGSGLFNPNSLMWSPELCAAVGIDPGSLPPLATDGFSYKELLSPFDQLLPELAHIPWLPAIGDGACSNVGSGCAGGDRLALMVGTSGAMRCVTCQPKLLPPPGLWCYRLDSRRFVFGGALSNGGNLFAWLQKNLQLPDPEAFERNLACMQPDSHGLTILPLLAGERSPGWAAHATGAIVGLRLNHTPMQIAQAMLEAVCLRFATIYSQLQQYAPEATSVMATGGALQRSPAWVQMMADALGVPVQISQEAEASCRGAALLAIEQLGLVDNIVDIPTQIGATYMPRAEYTAIYRQARQRLSELYRQLVATSQPASSVQLQTREPGPPCPHATEQNHVGHNP